MKLIAFAVLAGMAAVLTGCAGVDSEFECNATTSDRCMTMEQANEKARLATEGAAGKLAATALPTLVNPPVAVRPVSRPVAYTRPITPPATVTQPARVSTLTPRPLSTVNAAPLQRAAMPAPSCAPRRCQDAGEVRPVRTSERTANVWIAPYVDTQDVFHQPGRVSFVLTAPAWHMPAVIE
ncbi:type IV conjugative transfer system protein TraV [Chimaeribacter arupi]|nr:type IV conjugative transfer system protein TraV [Chimaeribacter arupi]